MHTLIINLVAFYFSLFIFYLSFFSELDGTWYILSRHTSFFQKSKFMIITFLNLPHWKLNYIEIETEKIRGHCALFKAPNVYSEHVINIHFIPLSNPLHAKKKNYIYIQFLAGVPLRIRRHKDLNLTKNIYHWWSCDPWSPNSD